MKNENIMKKVNTMNNEKAMNHKNITNTIVNIIRHNADKNGICIMPTLGTELRFRGITKQVLGVEKLSHYLMQMPEVELIDDNNAVRLTAAAQSAAQPAAADTPTSKTEHPMEEENAASTKGNGIQLIANWYEQLPAVAEVARPEDWSLGTNPYGVLKRYLIAQFRACEHEGKLLIHDGLAAFHTALYDHNFEPIFAVLICLDDRHFKLKGFCRPNTPQARELKNCFGLFPQRATYGSYEERYFDPNRFFLDEVAYNHILGNASRFPLAFVQRFCPQGFEVRDMMGASREAQEAYDMAFYRALMADQACLNLYRDILHGAVNRALRRVEENNAEAVLCYRCDRGCLHHLLPISLTDPDVVDFALMVRKEDDGSYFAPTILPVSACRCAARVVGKINNTWLK